jgi:hypothetical protein
MAEALFGIAGFFMGTGGSVVVAIIGVRHISKHPEIVTKFLAQKMVQEIRKQSTVK